MFPKNTVLVKHSIPSTKLYFYKLLNECRTSQNVEKSLKDINDLFQETELEFREIYFWEILHISEEKLGEIRLNKTDNFHEISKKSEGALTF